MSIFVLSRSIERNLLVRNGLFTGRLREQTRRLSLPAIEVNLSATGDTLVDRVANGFAFS
jgi:hypothetical protein